MRRLLGSLLMLTVLGGAAVYAAQPGTTGTEKRFQQQGLRLGVPVMAPASATATAGAATLDNAGAGVVTSEALTTAAAATYTLTLTSNMIASTDLVFASVAMGSATTGEPVLATVKPGAGSVVIIVKNVAASAALNGTIKISYFVVKVTPLGAD